MPLLKEMLFNKKKAKSLRGDMLARTGVYDNGNDSHDNRSSYTALLDTPTNSRALARSSSYADDEAVLINAVARQDTSAVRRSLEAGKADVNVLRNGMAPIHHACVTGDMNIVKLLMRYEADINLSTKENKTPVKLAALHGHFELAEYLIAMGGKDTDIVHGLR